MELLFLAEKANMYDSLNDNFSGDKAVCNIKNYMKTIHKIALTMQKCSALNDQTYTKESLKEKAVWKS